MTILFILIFSSLDRCIASLTFRFFFASYQTYFRLLKGSTTEFSQRAAVFVDRIVLNERIYLNFVGYFGYFANMDCERIYFQATILRSEFLGLYREGSSFAADWRTETTLFDRILLEALLTACGDFLLGQCNLQKSLAAWAYYSLYLAALADSLSWSMPTIFIYLQAPQLIQQHHSPKMQKIKKIVLFDVDGTLTKSRNKIEASMLDCLEQLRQVIDIGFVGGSDLHKISWQLGEEGVAKGKYLFSENGLLAYQGKTVIGQEEIGKYLGEERLKKFLNFCLRYLSQLDIPIKRGTFIEYRTGLINISPIGRNCSQSERDNFEHYDKHHKIRHKFIEELKHNFADYNLNYSIGGQISFDVFPKGWDKTYCLRYLKEYEEVYFFGDKTQAGGNDYQIYELLREKGRAFSVASFEDTIKLVREKFLSGEKKVE